MISEYERAWLRPNISAEQRAASFWPEIGPQGDVGDLAEMLHAHATDSARALEAERDRYREALIKVAQHPIEAPVSGRASLGIPAIPSCQTIARAALNGGQDDG